MASVKDLHFYNFGAKCQPLHKRLYYSFVPQYDITFMYIWIISKQFYYYLKNADLRSHWFIHRLAINILLIIYILIYINAIIDCSLSDIHSLKYILLKKVTFVVMEKREIIKSPWVLFFRFSFGRMHSLFMIHQISKVGNYLLHSELNRLFDQGMGNASHTQEFLRDHKYIIKEKFYTPMSL